MIFPIKALEKTLQDSIRESGYLSKINDLAKAKIDAMTDFPPEVNVSDFVDHIDYLVEKMGCLTC